VRAKLWTACVVGFLAGNTGYPSEGVGVAAGVFSRFQLVFDFVLVWMAPDLHGIQP